MERQNLGDRSPSPWMRRAAVALLIGGVTVGVSAMVSSGCTQANAKSAADKIALGKRISLIAACNDCHTPGTFYGNPDQGRLLSGSELGWEGPWGVTYPRNITPDVETGIGSWSEDDIVRAIRTGQRPDKSPLLPPMPWPMYAHMTDEEAYALAAYLKSIPPIRHRAPDRVNPGVATDSPRLTFPAPPAWDVAHVAAASNAHP